MKVEVEILELSKDLRQAMDVLVTAAIARNWELAWSMILDSEVLHTEIRHLVRDRLIQEGGDDGK